MCTSVGAVVGTSAPGRGALPFLMGVAATAVGRGAKVTLSARGAACGTARPLGSAAGRSAATRLPADSAADSAAVSQAPQASSVIGASSSDDEEQSGPSEDVTRACGFAGDSSEESESGPSEATHCA